MFSGERLPRESQLNISLEINKKKIPLILNVDVTKPKIQVKVYKHSFRLM